MVVMRLDEKDVKNEQPEQEIGSSEALGGSDETDQEDVKDEEPDRRLVLLKH